VNEAHQRVARIGAVKASIKKTVFAMKHGLFERLFTKVMPTAKLCRVSEFDTDTIAFPELLNRHN